MAVVFAKVARIDYPRAWPSLFTDLLQQMQSQNTLVMRRVYLVLHHALKELASKRLSSDQKAFAEVNGVSFAFLLAACSLQHTTDPSCIHSICCTHTWKSGSQYHILRFFPYMFCGVLKHSREGQ